MSTHSKAGFSSLSLCQCWLLAWVDHCLVRLCSKLPTNTDILNFPNHFLHSSSCHHRDECPPLSRATFHSVLLEHNTCEAMGREAEQCSGRGPPQMSWVSLAPNSPLLGGPDVTPDASSWAVLAQSSHLWRLKHWDIHPAVPWTLSPLNVESGRWEWCHFDKTFLLAICVYSVNACSYPVPFFCYVQFFSLKGLFLYLSVIWVTVVLFTQSFVFWTPFKLKKFRCSLKSESKSISFYFLAFWRALLVVSHHQREPKAVLNLLRVTEACKS